MWGDPKPWHREGFMHAQVQSCLTTVRVLLPVEVRE